MTDDTRAADPALNRLWRNLPQPDGRGVLLYITTAGTEAIGVEPKAVSNSGDKGTNAAGEQAAGGPTDADTAPVEESPKGRGRPRKAAPSGADVAAAPKTRDGTKQAQLVAMLRQKEGATVTEIVEALGWAPHTVRGAFAGALKKKLGLEVTSEKIEGRGRVYRVTD